MQYLTVPFDSHATHAFSQLEQGLDELLDMYCTVQVSFCQKFTIHYICVGFWQKV